MRSLCQQMAAPWPGLQFANGTFPDYLHHDKAPASTRYGEAMLGYGLLQTGVREHDDALIDAGLRGLGWFVAQTDLQRDHPSVFANAAVAAPTTWRAGARPDGRSSPRPARTGSGGCAGSRCCGCPTVPLCEQVPRRGGGGARAARHRPGLRRGGIGARAPERRAAPGRAADQRRRAAMADRGAFQVDGKRAYFLSDPEGGNPLAYQALSFGLYARGWPARRPGRLGGEDDAAGSPRLAGPEGPDGDVAYCGRSQEQGWSLALTAYGARGGDRAADASAVRTAAGAAGRRPPARRARHRAQGALHHPEPGPDYRGPGTASTATRRRRLQRPALAAAELGDRPHDDDALPAPSDDGRPTRGYRIEPGTAKQRLRGRRHGRGVVRGPKSAASTAPTTCATTSAWSRSKRARGQRVARRRASAPTPPTGPDSAGRSSAARPGPGCPTARTLGRRERTVTLTGGFRTAAGEWLRPRRALPLRAASTRGVRLIFPTEPGDRIKYSVFFVERRPAARRPRRSGLRQTAARDLRAASRGGVRRRALRLGRDARLVRANILFPREHR